MDFNDFCVTTYCRILDVSSAKLEAHDALLIADMLRKNSVLTLLNIGYNRLQSNGAAVLFEGLQYNTGLRYLDLSANDLHSSGIKAADIALANRTDGLELLNLGQNSMGDVGALFLVKSLQNNTALRHLLLPYHNAITDVGASIIAKDLIMSNKTRLEFIDLSGNPVTSEGAALFVSAMHSRVDSGLHPMRLKYDGWSLAFDMAKQLQEAVAMAPSAAHSEQRKTLMSEADFRSYASDPVNNVDERSVPRNEL
jgi:Ran GTPase-activating protein (RanGAP) involved in mRNA processing and transport